MIFSVFNLFAPFVGRSARTAMAVFFLATIALAGLAGEGHDHGDAAPAAAGTASPRIEAHSDLFELVGIVDQDRMTVYLDRYGTNEPVVGAKIEYEAGADKGLAQPQPDGTYRIEFAALGKPGELAFSFTLTAGADTDLLAGDLVMKDPHDQASDGPVAERPWLRWAGYGTGALALLAAALVLVRKSTAGRRVRLNA